MHISVMHISTAKAAAVRYLCCLRMPELLVLQGSPLLGAVFAVPNPGAGRLAILVAANICLVAHIFLLNDWSDLTTDHADPNRASTVFTTRGVSSKEMGRLALFMLALSLLFSRDLGLVPFGLTLAVAGLGALYSLPRFNWKGKPLLSSAAHLGGGALHFLLGYSVSADIDGRGLATAIYFALIFAAGHLTQELRDHEADASNGIRTNAVIFGRRRTFLASLVLFTASHALLFLLALQGAVPRPLAFLVVLYPLHLFWSLKALTDGLTYASVCRLQTRYRALYALAGVAMVAALCGAWR
jgi:4-hydroxybenzoate polyprenyltransferase